jgi:hypothetical protein
MTAAEDGSVAGAPTVRSRDRLVIEMIHVVGRSRAFLGEMAASERELELLSEPRAAAVLAALTSLRDVTRDGSLAAVQRAGTELLRLVDASS